MMLVCLLVPLEHNSFSIIFAAVIFRNILKLVLKILDGTRH